VVAFAHVQSDGSLDGVHSKNVSAATRTSTGIYCLKVDVAVTNVSAAVDLGAAGTAGSASVALSAEDPSGFVAAICPAGYNALIDAVSAAGANANLAFFVNFN
jgi:hypothetical protein